MEPNETVLKTDLTVLEHKLKGASGLAPYLEGIVSSMPLKAQKVLDGSIKQYCVGEIALYDELIKKGVKPMIAAQAAVCFPDPLKFHSRVETFSTMDTKKAFQSEIADGVDPLDALVIAATVARSHNIPEKEYELRTEKFAEFVNAQ